VSWHVSIRAAAQADLRAARDWYEQQRAGLGDEFLLSIADAMIRLEESPRRVPEYYHGFRRLLTERFPYKIFYRIESDAVIVFRILHVARDHARELK
jgi:plasmid stabilization system protein ParE